MGKEKGGLKIIERLCVGANKHIMHWKKIFSHSSWSLFPIFVSSSITTSFLILFVIQCMHNEVEMNFRQPCMHQDCVLYLGKYNNISANQVNMIPAKTCPVFIGREYLKLMPSVVNGSYRGK